MASLGRTWRGAGGGMPACQKNDQIKTRRGGPVETNGSAALAVIFWGLCSRLGDWIIFPALVTYKPCLDTSDAPDRIFVVS